MTRIMIVGAMLLALTLFGCDSPEEPEPTRDTEEKVEEKTEPVTEEGAETEGQTEQALEEAAEETEETAEAAVDKTEEMMAEAEEETKEAVEATEEKATEVAEEVEEAVNPETLVLEASFGEVTFPHAMHSNAYDCTTCHGEGEPGLFGLEKDEAHSLCKGCHQDEGAGPTGCKDCHGS